jgi:hypothetical protein
VPNQFKVLAQSQLIPVEGGAHTYDVRIPVASSDQLALWGVTGTLLCASGGPNNVASVIGNSAPGTTATYTPQSVTGLPVKATVEPDADLDGYGDVSQDLCPQSASFQTVCPVFRLDSSASAHGNSITVLVATNDTAVVSIAGSAKVRGKKVQLKSAGKTVPSGTLFKFTVKLPKSLRSALAALPPGKGVKVQLVATAVDTLGRTFTDTSKVKLPGTK